MIVYAPKYYLNFRCIANKCRHSCCEGWRVGVDADTYLMAKSSDLSILQELYERANVSDEGIHIELCDGKCPFLNDGLCRIISLVGDEFIPEICKEHPRFYNHLGDCYQMGIGLSCEEAARIILSSDSYSDIVAIGEIDDDEYPVSMYQHTAALIQLISLSTYKEAALRIADGYGLSAVGELSDVFLGLEYLDAENERLFSAPHGERYLNDEYMKRLLAYFVYRYTSVAENELDLKARILFSLLSSLTVENVARCKGCASFEEIVECARVYSQEIEYNEDTVSGLLFELECRILGE